MSRLLVVHPGSQFSTGDVYRGITAGLKAAGVEVGSYALTDRIEAASEWVKLLQRRIRRRDPSRPLMSKDERMQRIFDEAAKDVLAMALDNDVAGVLIVSAMFIPGQTLWRLRRAGIPVGLLLTECPYDDERHMQIAPLADVVWANERTSVARLRTVQPNTHYLAAAYDPAMHTAEPQPGDEEMAAHDVVFVGTAFRERLDLLAAVDWTGIDLGLYGNFQAGVGGHRADARCRRILDPHIRGGLVTNAQAGALYRRAKIGLNLYRTSIDFRGKQHVVGAESLNPRAYELAAVGCCQVTDWRAEVSEVFGSGVLAFGGPPTRWEHTDAAGNTSVVDVARPALADDLSRIVRHLLTQDFWRNVAAMTAIDAIQSHTFTARARQMMTDWPEVLAPEGVLAAYG